MNQTVSILKINHNFQDNSPDKKALSDLLQTTKKVDSKFFKEYSSIQKRTEPSRGSAKYNINPPRMIQL